MAAAIDDKALATDLADYLVRRGMPFREAHRVIGSLVRRAIADGRALASYSLAELQAHDVAFGADVMSLLNLDASLAQRNIAGGTGPEAVNRQLAQARAALAAGAAA
jgi:argininosuccinate lyase